MSFMVKAVTEVLRPLPSIYVIALLSKLCPADSC